MKETPIVVLSYNKSKLTQRCLTSILDAGYSTERIHLIDNGSDEGILEQHQLSFPKIKTLRIPQNRGFAGGFNSGLESVFSDGHESALFLTNDTEISNETVEALSDCSQTHHAGLVAPCLVYRKHPDQIDSVGGKFLRQSGQLTHTKSTGNAPILNKDEYIPGTALWITAKAFKSLGGTNEEYFMYWEDVDLSYRAHQQKVIQARSYDAKIRHGIGQTCHKKPKYTTYYFQRNRIRFCRTYLSVEEWSSVSKIIKDELAQLEQKWIEKNDQRRLQYLDELYNCLNKE